MVTEKAAFGVLSVILLSTLLTMAWKKQHNLFGTLFFLSLVSSMAFYLFTFGELSQFSIEGLSAKAQLIREKVTQVQEDSEAVQKLKSESAENAALIKSLLANISATQRQLSTAQKEFREKAVSLDSQLNDVNGTLTTNSSGLQTLTESLTEFFKSRHTALTDEQARVENHASVKEEEMNRLEKQLKDASGSDVTAEPQATWVKRIADAKADISQDDNELADIMSELGYVDNYLLTLTGTVPGMQVLTPVGATSVVPKK